ncbi:MAG: winged helix-turn-helix transcriptional regulator [Sphingopyxis sp.]
MKKEIPGWVDKVDPCEAGCPSRDILDLIGDRWSLLLLLVIAQGLHRNGELKRRVGGISQKMLTQTLRALEANGLVERRDFRTVPPHVEYHLTGLGASLGEALTPLFGWIEREFDAVLAARAAFAAREGGQAAESAS